MPARRAALAIAIVVLLSLAGCRGPTSPSPKLTLQPAPFEQLAGWNSDNLAAAVSAFLRSCAAFLARNGGEPLDPSVKSANFGTVDDWRRICAEAAQLPPGAAAAKFFFESNFVPLLAGNRGDQNGLFTGYYEIALNGSRYRRGLFQTPIYRPPPDPKAYTRAEIEDGALADKGLELLWVDDPIGAFFLAVQGSGVVHLTDGSTVRLGYDRSNGRKYVAIGRLLVERGEVALKDMTMETLRSWIATHAEIGTALMREDPSYVFFKEIPGDGPYGSENVVLTAGRSLAVDRAYIPLGVPVWLYAAERFKPGAIQRLVVAQDTGGAIKGPVRGDLYWGSGDAAGRDAGSMNATGHYYLLLPRAIAARAVAAASGD
jgi:membrane-bound lytic murein transglycosylase A